MDENYIAAPLGLINAKDLKPNEIFICRIDYPEFPDHIMGIYIKDNYLVIRTDFWNLFEKKSQHNSRGIPP